MKRRFITLAVTAIMLASLICAMAVPAFANYGGPNPTEFSGKVGESAKFVLNPGLGLNIDGVTDFTGSVPPGMSYGLSGGKLFISGTPSKAGFYQLLFKAHVASYEDYETQLAAIITIEDSSKPDYVLDTYYDTVNVGQSTRYSFDMGCAGYISDMRVYGTLPSGMTVSHDSYSVYLKGTPLQTGVLTFNLQAYDSANRCWATQPVQLTVRGEAKPSVTKSPTSETVIEGNRALFVARADNYTSINWTLSSPNGSTQYNAKDAARYISGLRVSGTGNECLALDNIPLSMNGWQVQARFDSAAGSAYSNIAYVYVNPMVIKDPVFTKQPVGTTLKPGETVTLTAEAQSPDGDQITYQWFKCTNSSVTSGIDLPGETAPTLVVSYEEGVSFYYCFAYCSRGDHYSSMVNSEMAAVTGEAPATVPTTAPTEPATVPTEAPTETTAPTEAPVKPTEQPAPTTAPVQPAPAAADHTVAYIAGAVAIVSIICATVLILQHNRGKYQRDE